MLSTYHLQANELDDHFIRAIHQLFANKTIKIIVSEADETDYLMSSPANYAHLMEAIQHVKEGKELIPVNMEDYQ